MADSSVVNLDSDFMRSWRSDFDVLDCQVLTSFPGDSCLCNSSIWVLTGGSRRRMCVTLQVMVYPNAVSMMSFEVQCGVAYLSLILRYHGDDLSSDELRRGLKLRRANSIIFCGL
jgi:hypothetical protein